MSSSSRAFTKQILTEDNLNTQWTNFLEFFQNTAATNNPPNEDASIKNSEVEFPGCLPNQINQASMKTQVG